jgi:hypothetical protein
MLGMPSSVCATMRAIFRERSGRCDVESIRSAIENASNHLTQHSEAAASTDAAATAVREEGLRFRVEGPQGDVISDMSKAVGGGATAPTPGWVASRRARVV